MVTGSDVGVILLDDLEADQAAVDEHVRRR